MASVQETAVEYISNARTLLATRLQNLPIVLENLYQGKILTDDDVRAINAETESSDKTRKVLDVVISKGEAASCELLRILDFTRDGTLPKPLSSTDHDLHQWISCFPFRDDPETGYTAGSRACDRYQRQLRTTARGIFKDQMEQSSRISGGKTVEAFTYTPLVFDTDRDRNTALAKMKMKDKKPEKQQTYIPENKQNLSPEDLLKSHERKILLVGKPGIGKTAVVQEMLHLWMEREDGQPNYMFYFDERALSQISTSMSLEHLLFDMYLKPVEHREEVLQDIEENSDNVVIVFDGVTDASYNSILKKIMDKDILTDAKVVITCRSEAEFDFFPSGSSWYRVYVQGFSDESIRAYLTKMLSAEPDSASSVVNNPQLFSLCHCPMYASMLVACMSCCTAEAAEKPGTATEMHVRILRHCVAKQGNKDLSHVDQHIKDNRDIILSLAGSAFNATKQKTAILPEFDCEEGSIQYAFLKSVTSTESPEFARTCYAFLHNTMQEFFAALWLLGNPDEVDYLLQRCQTEQGQHMRHVIPFLCGLLSDRNIPRVKCLVPEEQIKLTSDGLFEKILNPFLQSHTEQDHENDPITVEVKDLLFVCQCLYESQSPEACSLFSRKVNHHLDLSEEHLDPHQCCAVSYVISQTRGKEFWLNLENCTVSDPGLKLIIGCSQHLRFTLWSDLSKQTQFLMDFFHKAAECERPTEEKTPVCSKQCDFLLDLYSHVKDYETQTGRSVLPALQPVYQSPIVWYIDLSERKASLFLEVLKLQTEKKPVKLRGWSDEESEVRSFLQCLPYISQLRYDEDGSEEAVQFLLNLSAAAAECYTETDPAERCLELLASVFSDSTYPFHCDIKDNDSDGGSVDSDQSECILFHESTRLCDFLLYLYSHVKDYETQTGKSVLPALQEVYRTVGVKTWNVDLSERKVSLFLQVLELHKEKQSVVLRGWSDEEGELKSLLQCLPYISQLRFKRPENQRPSLEEWNKRVRSFLLDLCLQAALDQRETIQTTVEKLILPYSNTNYDAEFMLDLYSLVKDYETLTDRSVLPALQPVYQSVPAVWHIDLSKRKASLFLEVQKLQTEKKPVVLRGWSNEESEVRSFLQCLPHISQLSICLMTLERAARDGPPQVAAQFLLNLSVAAAECDTAAGESFSKLLSSDTATGESFSKLLSSDTAAGESFSKLLSSDTATGECFSKLLSSDTAAGASFSKLLSSDTATGECFSKLLSSDTAAGESFSKLLSSDTATGECFSKLLSSDTAAGASFSKLLSSVCSYSTFPCRYDRFDPNIQCEFLLALYSHMKDYERQTGKSIIPAFKEVYQSAPEEWYVDVSERNASLFLEVLELQTEKKPVELRGWSDEESEVRSLIQWLPYISKLRVHLGALNGPDVDGTLKAANQFLLTLNVLAAECETEAGRRFSKLLSSVCSYSTFPFNVDYFNGLTQCGLLLNLYSHVKDYETQTGRSVLPALQPVYQSAPEIWDIDLTERKASFFLEVLKLQTGKKPVKLWNWSNEESEVRSFLQCLPYISQLGFHDKLIDDGTSEEAVQFLLNLSVAAAECDPATGESFSKLLSSDTATGESFSKLVSSDAATGESFSKLVSSDAATGESFSKLLSSACSYDDFPFHSPDYNYDDYHYYYKEITTSTQCDILLDLFSRVKDHETQTGRSVLPALQPVYQSAPAVWNIDLSERKASLFLEVLKLQTVKKPVDLRGLTDEESELRDFLQCLPYISELGFHEIRNEEAVQFLLNLWVAVQSDPATGESFSKLLCSACSYSNFPFPDDFEYGPGERCKFLLDLYSRVKDYDAETGGSVLPALRPVYQSVPPVWHMHVKGIKASLFPEVLKLQTEKKPVELTGWSEKKSDVRSFLQCLPYISQLSHYEPFLPSMCKVVGSREEAEQVVPLLQALGFTLTLGGVLPSHTCRSVGRVLGLSASRLDLTLTPQAISLKGARLLFRHVTHLHKLRLSASMVVRMARALRTVRGSAPVTIEELSLVLSSTQQPEGALSRVLSSLASLLRHWTVQCLDLTDCKMEGDSLMVLLCHQGPLAIRLHKESLLALLVYEAQEVELTRSFLEKVGGDLTSCSLTWEVLHYLLQHRDQRVTVDFRKSKITDQNARDVLRFLNRIQFKWLSSSFVMSIIREIYDTDAAHSVSSLLSSSENCINLSARVLDAVDCAALRFTLQHSKGVQLNLLWTSIPEGEIESMLPLLHTISKLRVDRKLLLRFLHCCVASELQQGAAAALLRALQHRLDFSCCSAVDLTAHTQGEVLCLSPEDCRVVSIVIQRADADTQLVLQDCVVSDTALEELLPLPPRVQLSSSKDLLCRFLALIRVGTEGESVRRAVSLARALGGEVDLSETRLDPRACGSLALVLEHSEALSKLNLYNCQITDYSVNLLLPHLHKAEVLNLSSNDITDCLAKKLYDVVTTSSSIKKLKLLDNNIVNKQPFMAEKRFQVWWGLHFD